MVIASFIILTFSIIFDNYLQYGQMLDFYELGKMFQGGKSVLFTWIIITIIHFTIILVTKFALKTSIVLWLPVYFAHLASILYFSIHVAQ
jgi:hypothetical protein